MKKTNGLNKNQQRAKGKLTKQKGDWSELMVQAHYCKLGWWIYPKMSGPIDLIILNKKTGRVRFIDSKSTCGRKSTTTNGKKISRVISHPIKDKVKIEIVYVDDDGDVKEAYGKGRREWNKEYKIARNKYGQYTGEVLRK